MNDAVRTHVVALAAPSTRLKAAQALSRTLGCEQLFLFVRDTEIGVLVPAQGMPKTLTGGPLWRAFLTQCVADGRHNGEVDLSPASRHPAVALVKDGAAAMFVGGAPDQDGLAAFATLMPLLGALLKVESHWALGQSEIREARLAADRAHALVQALDAARASAAGLNEQLRREHSRKDEFLAMLSHELRNPLAPLVNSLSLLRQYPDLDGAMARRQLDVMGRQVEQLTRLVDDLLDVSRVSRGLIELRRERLPLADVLDTALEAARPAMEARRHNLRTFGERGPLFVDGDRVRLTQVFANLLQNAAKYTPPGGTIQLGVVPDGSRVSVLVRDNGLGIPPEMLTRVFDLFQQLPVSLDRAQGGLGIGLTLVRTLAELHGGHVTAHSVGRGHGSTFTVSLPLAPAPAADSAAPAAGLFKSVEARVLVVDDNADAADSLADVLRFMGAQVRVARDGSEALDLAHSFTPDLVFLDIGLPGMDGYEVARSLRRLPGLNARLVALTGYGSSRDRERSKEAGFDDHLVKPVTGASIAAILTSSGFGGPQRVEY